MHSFSFLFLSCFVLLSNNTYFCHSFVIMTVTKRPLYLQLTNNVEFENPKVTLKRDTTIAEFNHDVEVTLDQLPEALAARNKY